MKSKSIINNNLSKHLKDAEESVLEWHEDTFNAIKKKPRRSDLIVMGALLVARKHTLAILALIKERHLLPAQALLRVLIELHIKFHWVMRRIKIRTVLNDKKINSRLQQLDKRRVEDDKKLIKDLNENRFPQKNKIITELDKQWAKYQRRRIKKSPDIASICQKLDKLAVLGTPNNNMSWASVIYPEFYRKYSRAIHSDLGLIRKFVINRKNKILWYEDIEDDPKNIIEYALTVFADINKLFLNYYK